MTATLSKQDIPATDSGTDDSRHSLSTRSAKRSRWPRRLFKRRWLKIFRPRHLFRASAVLLLVAGFVHVSLMNDVFSSSDDSAGALNVLAYGYTAYQYDHSAYDRSGATPSIVKSSMPSYSGGLARLNSSDVAMSDPKLAEGIAKEFTTYEVPEGGSLWRTGKQFIADEILLDQLIDNLEERGMEVSKVRAGEQFLVSDRGSEGLLVVIEVEGSTYESRVYESDVVTSLRRIAPSGGNKLNTAYLSQ